MCIRDSIDPISDEEKASWPESVLVDLPSSFDDDRGSIQPLVDMAMKSSVLIDSNSGAVRANHYHKTDWHFIYVLKGSFEYYFKNTNTQDKIIKKIVNKNDLLFTGPLVDHAMFYTEETKILVLSKNPRDQKTYEEDTVRIDFMNDNNRF